jgi:hypothetical protein
MCTVREPIVTRTSSSVSGSSQSADLVLIRIMSCAPAPFRPVSDRSARV